MSTHREHGGLCYTLAQQFHPFKLVHYSSKAKNMHMPLQLFITFTRVFSTVEFSVDCMYRCNVYYHDKLSENRVTCSFPNFKSFLLLPNSYHYTCDTDFYNTHFHCQNKRFRIFICFGHKQLAQGCARAHFIDMCKHRG